MKCLVRDCDILSRDADFENHICRYHIHKRMAHLLEEHLNKILFHKITQNGFDGIVMGANATYRQFGMSPPEILHLLWIGLCDYLWQGFYKKLSGDLRKRLDIVSINMVIRLSRQKFETLPDVSCFRNGISIRKDKMSGKEKLARVFLLYTCFMDTYFVKELRKCNKRDHAKYNIPAFEWSKVKVREWFKFLGWTICLNA